MQGTKLRSLAGELGSTCHGTTKSVHHSYYNKIQFAATKTQRTQINNYLKKKKPSKNWFCFKPSSYQLGISFGQAAWHAGSQFPLQGLNPSPPAVEAQSLNHWTAREALYARHFLGPPFHFLCMAPGTDKEEILLCIYLPTPKSQKAHVVANPHIEIVYDWDV